MAICPSDMDSLHDEPWNCCGQSLIPIEAASSGVGKVISTTLLLVLDEAERGGVFMLDFLLCTSFVFVKVRLLAGEVLVVH